MKYSQEPFLSLVEEAYNGRLQLPAFQRDWKWERKKVISLYDSLRKHFPIGGFLFLETSPEYDLSPQPYEGSSQEYPPSRLTLDGQQRITSGIVLLHGTPSSPQTPNPPRYFLNLAALIKLAENYRPDQSTSPGLDYLNEEEVKKFVQYIDDSDNYMIATTRRTELTTLLLENHLLSSTYLANRVTAQIALEQYESRYPDTRQFLKYVVVPYFTLETDSRHPVTTLTSSESLSAVTKIFATINTTGKRLTPIEIVTAVLYASDINLRQELTELKQISDYLSNMDPDGEVLLQTIALLANESPKKSLLPKTIDFKLFKAFYGEAHDLLDTVGNYLTRELGVGLKDTSKLIPYNSILAPMAVCFKDINGMNETQTSAALEKIDKWFVGAAIGQRYIEGVGNKQETDARDMRKWIKENKPEFKPEWLSKVRISPDIKLASQTGAIANLLRCLINRQKPIDLLKKTKIGYYDDSQEYPEEHHIWPTKFCNEFVSGWDKNTDKNEHALNLIPVALETNRKWLNMDPKNQMDDVKSKIPNETKRCDSLKELLLSEECVQILERTTKTKTDYFDFLEARFRVLCSELALWDFTLGEQEYQDENATEE